MERELIHWFEDGTYYSSHTIGSMTIKFEAVEEDDLKSSTSVLRTALEQCQLDYDSVLDDVMHSGWNNRRVLICTGMRLIPEDITASTKEDAFNKYMERIALENGLMV